MRAFLKIMLVSVTLMLVSCHSEPSLQRYYVDHQADDDFVVMDFSTNLLFGQLDTVPDTYKKALKRIKKVNILAFPLQKGKVKKYKTERKTVWNILHNGDYKLLFKIKFSDKDLELYYLGDEGAIDEFVLSAYDDSKGFLLARLLGKDMNPQALTGLMRMTAKGKIDLDLKHLDTIINRFN